MSLAILFNTPQPYDFWRDSIWQFIGVGVAILLGVPAIVFAIMSYRKTKQQSQKEVTYELISSTPMLSINEEVKNKVQILYNNKPINDACIVAVKIWNTGYVPITPNDYIEPITIKFGTSTEILEAEISETAPPNIKVSLNKDNKEIVLKPFLLNSKETVVVKTLLTNFDDQILIEARIIGAQQILGTKFEVNASVLSLTMVKSAIEIAARSIPIFGPLAGEITVAAMEKYLSKPTKKSTVNNKEPLLLNNEVYKDNSSPLISLIDNSFVAKKQENTSDPNEQKITK